MRIRLSALLFFTLAVLPAWKAVAQPQIRHVLFLGNSYIYTNSMPQLLANMATSTGDTLIHDSHTPGGYSLWNHFNDTISTNKVKDGGWDYVVVQEQSQLPSFDTYDFYYASYFNDLTNVHNPCARTLYYMTWGRQNGDALNCDMFPWVCTYEGMDSMLALRYMEMAAANDAEVSPVGKVWKHIRQNFPSINLYQSDGSHPSLAGSYLVACCFYTSIFKKNPELIAFNSALSALEATTIRQATKAILFDSLDNYGFIDPNPVAGFSFVVGPGTNQLIFTNTSSNADFYLWDFGDGVTSTEKHPTHNYANNGEYVITLTATNCDLTNNYTVAQQATAGFCAHTPTVSPDALILCPGASDSIVTQPFDAYQWFDANGDAIPGATNQFYEPSGAALYSVMTTQGNCSEMSEQVFVGSAESAWFYVIGVGNSGIFGMGCIGDTVYLSVATTMLTSPNLDPFVTWYKDSVLLPLPPSDSLMITEAGLYGVSVEHPNCPGYIAAQYLNIDFVFIECETGISNGIEVPTVAMFPNPAGHVVRIKNNRAENLNCSIVDATGRTIKRIDLMSGENVIPINEFASGVYFVTFDATGVSPLKLIKL
ncbi:MAG TPA: PKD domain-containing protein [Chitinophagales bacterium]|nr:PKD domain-containing protein [Chitinophagales bacterium]